MAISYKNSRNILTTKAKTATHTSNLSPKNICPKTLPILDAREEEANVEEKDMAYTAGSFNLP
jgi:hypothetical protein